MIQRSDCDTAGWRNTNGFPVRTKNVKSESGHWHFWSMLFRNLQPHGEKSHMSFLLPNNCVRQYPFVGDAPSCSQRPMVFPASLQSGVEACPRNADKLVLACVRLWKNVLGRTRRWHSEKRIEVIFAQLRIGTRCVQLIVCCGYFQSQQWQVLGCMGIFIYLCSSRLRADSTHFTSRPCWWDRTSVFSICK